MDFSPPPTHLHAVEDEEESLWGERQKFSKDCTKPAQRQANQEQRGQQ